MAKFVKQAGVYLYGTVKIVRAALPSMDATEVWKKMTKMAVDPRTQKMTTGKIDSWQKQSEGGTDPFV